MPQLVMTHQKKIVALQVKDLGITTDDAGQEFGHIEAYGAIFNNVDADKDRILPHAFKRTIHSAKDRAVARKSPYIVPMLWQHDTHELIGGWSDLVEDDYGLKGIGAIALATQRGREYYALAKAGMADQFSIIYDVPQGGATYDKSGVRDLSELRLFTLDPVTLAANDETYLINIKSDTSATGAKAGASPIVCGNLTGPIGPRDEAWDGGQAEGQIWAAAYDDARGTINAPLAKKYFMLLDGDPQQKGSYSYPFWYVGSRPHICVGAVKAIAAAVQGSRGASAPEALQAPVTKLYARITKKYPADPPLVPPWADGTDASKKGHTMPDALKRLPARMQRKTFQEHYAEEQCEDLLRDWQDVVITALTAAVYDAFQIGDEPESDVKAALDAFGDAVMAWVAEGVEYNLADYLDNQGGDGGTENALQYGSESRPNYGGFMSRRTPLARKATKAMLAADATTGGFTADHVDKLKGAATKALKKVADHAATLHEAADSVSQMVSGAAKAAYDTKDARDAKAGRAFSAANAAALQDHADSLHDAADSLQKSMQRHMKSVQTVADDLATVLQGSEAAYGTDPGTPADDEQENKARTAHTTHRGTPSSQARSLQPPPSEEDTVTEADLAAALASLQLLRQSV